jgi:hypothetical protein
MCKKLCKSPARRGALVLARDGDVGSRHLMCDALTSDACVPP